MFTTRGGLAAEVQRQREAHLRCLRFRREEAVRESLLRLHSGAYSCVANAAHVVAALDPAQAVSERGEILLRARRSHAITEGVARAGILARPMIGDDRSVEAYSRREDVPEGVLIRHLLTPTPRAGLLAAARATKLPGWAVSHIACLALDTRASVPSNAACQPLALYALGAWAARRLGFADPSMASLVDSALRASVCDERPADAAVGIGANATLLAMALVGHVATARRIARSIEVSGATQDKLFALGLLGVPIVADALVAQMSSSHPALRAEALRALYLMTGRMFVVGGEQAMRHDGDGLEPDPAAAEIFLRTWPHRHVVGRFHLGRPLDRDDEKAPASFQLLRAILTGRPRALGAESLPGLFDGRSRVRATPFSICAPVAPALAVGRAAGSAP